MIEQAGAGEGARRQQEARSWPAQDSRGLFRLMITTPGKAVGRSTRTGRLKIWDEKMETLTGAELEALQLERLRATLRAHLGGRRPVPRSDGGGGLHPESVELAPTARASSRSRARRSSGTTIRSGMLAVPLGEVVRLHASSGTTGSRTLVAYTAADLDDLDRAGGPVRDRGRRGVHRRRPDIFHLRAFHRRLRPALRPGEDSAPRSFPRPAATPSCSSR